MTSFKLRVFAAFGGGGFGVSGFQKPETRLYGNTATFDVCGGVDIDWYACRAFRYMTGAEQHQMDVSTMTVEDMRRIMGETPPDVVFGSAPCKGSSKLLSNKRAQEEHYQELNKLSLIFVKLMLAAYPDRPPPILVFENVPNITSRAKDMLADLRRVVTAAGYATQDGYHECRNVGDLAQMRRRWFMVCRHIEQVPAFLYKPPKKKGKVCGDVLGPLPLPGDHRGGPMHKLPRTSFINLLRLWAIPPGGDWRDLPGVVQEGKQRRQYFRRHLVQEWDQPAATIGGTGSNGPCAIDDPRVSDADAPAIDIAAKGYRGAWGVLDPDQPSGTVTGNGRVATGAFSIADRRIKLEPDKPCFDAGYGVLSQDQPSRTIAGKTSVGCGAYAIAENRIDLVPQRGNEDLHYGKYHLVPWDGPAKTVTTAGRIGSGALSIADIRINCKPRAGAYGVMAYTAPSPTITAKGKVDNSVQAVAAPVRHDLPPDYVVLDYETVCQIVNGEISIPFAIVDADHPTEPICVVDDLKSYPYRPVITVGPKGKTVVKKHPVNLVLISADGSYHRPLTTLELAVLQGIDWMHKDAPLDFGGASTKQRELIGNAVPPPVGAAFAEQMAMTLIASRLGLWFLDQSGGGVWVRPDFAKELRREGVAILGPNDVLALVDGADLEDDDDEPAAEPLDACADLRADQ